MILEVYPVEESDLADLSRIRSLSYQFLHTDKDYTLEETKEWFKNLPEDYAYYVIKLMSNDPKRKWDNRIIGYFRTVHKDDNIIEVGADLDPEYRGKGLAYQVYVKFLEELKACGYKNAILSVRGDNVVGYNLYRKLGFEITYTEDHKLSNGRLVPSIHMRKKL